MTAILLVLLGVLLSVLLIVIGLAALYVATQPRGDFEEWRQ